MKTRITAVLATLVVALSLVATASAAPHKGTVRGWDYYGPATVKTWDTYRPGGSSWSSVKPWARAQT